MKYPNEEERKDLAAVGFGAPREKTAQVNGLPDTITVELQRGREAVFATNVFGGPMREYEPGKWESAVWPSDGSWLWKPVGEAHPDAIVHLGAFDEEGVFHIKVLGRVRDTPFIKGPRGPLKTAYYSPVVAPMAPKHPWHVSPHEEATPKHS